MGLEGPAHSEHHAGREAGEPHAAVLSPSQNSPLM